MWCKIKAKSLHWNASIRRNQSVNYTVWCCTVYFTVSYILWYVPHIVCWIPSLSAFAWPQIMLTINCIYCITVCNLQTVVQYDTVVIQYCTVQRRSEYKPLGSTAVVILYCPVLQSVLNLFQFHIFPTSIGHCYCDATHYNMKVCRRWQVVIGIVFDNLRLAQKRKGNLLRARWTILRPVYSLATVVAGTLICRLCILGIGSALGP